MLYPTLNQPLIIVVMLLCGFAGGVIFDLCRLLTLLSGNDKVSKHIFDFLAVLLGFALLFFVNLKFNYGQFRVYVFAVFMFSFVLQQKLSQKLWTKLLGKWYSSIVQRREEWKKKKNKNG